MEPERKIEKLLRAFAKKRRTDAGDAFKLHPATRRMLQDAVARRVTKAGQPGWVLRFLGGLRSGFVMAAGFAVLVFMGAALFLPGLSKAKHRSQMAGAMGNLKQIGMATKQFAEENQQQLPVALSELQPFADTNLLLDPASGKPFVYVAGGRNVDSLRADSVMAYSPEDRKSRAVLFADGHVEAVDRTRFSEITNRGLIQLASADAPARREFAAAPAAAVVAGNEYGAAKASEPAGIAVSRSAAEKSKSAAGELRQTDAVDFTLAGVVAATALPERESKLDATATTSGLYFNTKEGIAGNAQSRRLNSSNAGLQNVFKNAAASVKVTPVLANFQFQQNGSAIAVVDADGSVYHGRLLADREVVQNAPAAKKLPALAVPSALARDKDEAMQNQAGGAQSYFFRVAGTNRSLKQSVVFTGSIVALTNSLSLTDASGSGLFQGGSGDGNLKAPSEVNQLQSQAGFFSNSRIEGTAVINRTNAIEINALPVAP